VRQARGRLESLERSTYSMPFGRDGLLVRPFSCLPTNAHSQPRAICDGATPGGAVYAVEISQVHMYNTKSITLSSVSTWSSPGPTDGIF
jgi:hypothetical protein